jgi:hypothetical protein
MPGAYILAAWGDLRRFNIPPEPAGLLHLGMGELGE